MWAAICCMVVSSCDWNDEEIAEYIITDYSNATITELSLSDNIDVCYSLSTFAFTIDHYGHSDPALVADYPDAGIIFNSDSLPVGTIADSIEVNLTYTAPSEVIFYQYDVNDTVVNTVDFSEKQVISFSPYTKTRIEITAQDGITKKSYFVKVNVHQVEGDTIIWQYVQQDAWDTSDITAQAVDTLGSTLLWFTQHSNNTCQLRTADLYGDVTSWSAPAVLTLPESLDLSSITTWRQTLYAVGTDSQQLYTSTDGQNWTVSGNTHTFVNLLGVQLKGRKNDEQLTAIILESGTYTFATSTDGQNWTIGTALPAGFPIRGYSNPIAVAAKPLSGNVTSRLYIVGGYTADNILTSSTWSCDGSQWAEFTQNKLPAMRGAAIVPYTLDTDEPRTFWLMQPGITAEGPVSDIYFSENSGVSWKLLRDEFEDYADNDSIEAFGNTSAFYNPHTYQMYFLGGEKAEGCQTSDIIGGQLIKLTFDKRR